MIVPLCTVVVLLATPSAAQGSGNSTLTSPCPGVFGYTPTGLVPGLWVGVANLSTEFPLRSLRLNIVLDSPALEFGQLWHWVGNTFIQNDVEYIIENYDLQIYPEQPVTVRFFVRYDPMSRAPRLQAIRLNGKVICDADTQGATSNAPVSSDLRQPGSSFPGSKTRPNQSENPLQSPPSYFQGYPRLVNNSSADFYAKLYNPNTQTKSKSVECGVLSGGRIIYSEDRTYMKGEIPWLVAVFARERTSLQFTCAGTLVSDRHVISAINCIQRNRYNTESELRDLVVKLGVHNVNDTTEDVVTRKLLSVSLHEDFNPKTYENNILIMTLEKRVPFNNFIRPACLWSGDINLSRVVGTTGIVAGWGIRSSTFKLSLPSISTWTNSYDVPIPTRTITHDVPYLLRVPVVSTKDCMASHAGFQSITSEKTLCAGSRNGVGPCLGDSGAGLLLLDGDRWTLRGVVSLSLRDDYVDYQCNLFEYTVYTDVAQYLPWIRNILSQKYID